MDKKSFTINSNAPLFDELAKRPTWWNMILNDNDLYVNVRKNNHINVYYRGASIMSLRYDSKFIAEIHNYYLGYDKDRCGKLACPYGMVNKDPKEIVACIDMIKYRVKKNPKYWADDGQPEDWSEKYVQSCMYKGEEYCVDNECYIDTEFACRLNDGTDIRIDLVKLVNNTIQFVELKRVQDNRLTPKQNCNSCAEIITQMNNYADFIKEVTGQKDVVLGYYRSILEIMEKIGIDMKAKSKDVMKLSDHVELFITYYKEKSPGRKARLEKIKETLKGYCSNIDDVICKFNALP